MKWVWVLKRFDKCSSDVPHCSSPSGVTTSIFMYMYVLDTTLIIKKKCKSQKQHSLNISVERNYNYSPQKLTFFMSIIQILWYLLFLAAYHNVAFYYCYGCDKKSFCGIALYQGSPTGSSHLIISSSPNVQTNVNKYHKIVTKVLNLLKSQ